MSKIIKALSGPKYDGKYLHDLVGQKLGSRKLHQTLTNVVIPTFDIKQLQPTTFSSYEVKSKPCFDALLSDVCIATSDAPTYLSAYYFETIDPEGNVKDFNLIDGGVAANNLTRLAIGEVTKTIISGSEDLFPIKPMDYGRFLVISLGTGSPKAEFKYRAHDCLLLARGIGLPSCTEEQLVFHLALESLPIWVSGNWFTLSHWRAISLSSRTGEQTQIGVGGLVYPLALETMEVVVVSAAEESWNAGQHK